ncbi:MAG TPA: MFS transporter [Bryobacteraceae bacterium]|nr:MFS transporter [Bryobacteraceae bacterium]
MLAIMAYGESRSYNLRLQPDPSSPSAVSATIGASRRALAGFFVSGALLSTPGAVLPAWGYHLRPHFVMVGHYFLALNTGVLLGAVLSFPLLRRRGIKGPLTGASAIASASLVVLAFMGPPVNEWWRVPPLVALGAAVAVLNTGIFHALSPAYLRNRAATVNIGGVLFGLGSFVAPLLVAGTFNFYRVSLIFLVLAALPGAYAVICSRRKFPKPEGLDRHEHDQQTRPQWTIPAAILLAALLFFHFGNEFAIAGWLPLFLIGRLGMSPVSAMILVASYWLALTAGRLTAQLLLPAVSHSWLLLGSAVAALFGCLILTFTDNRFGAWSGTLLVGFGFAPIYPLVVEKIGARFPTYHPGLFNGIFSAGLTGGLLAPATLGYAGEWFGIRVVMALPAAGTAIVVVLVLAIWAEAKVASWMDAKPN